MPPHRFLALFAVALISSPLAAGQEISEPLSPRERAVHLLSRLAYGPAPGDVARILELGEEAWLEAQLAPGEPGPATLLNRLSRFPTLELVPRECLDLVDTVDDDGTREARKKRDRARNQPTKELTEALLLRAVYSNRQLEEVLCDFWRNHLNVSFTKGWPAPVYIPDYERTVLRANALGSFPEMLRASARHPAMLHYLDNYLSRRPPSRQALAEYARKVRRETGSAERGAEAAAIAARRGLNENYARELMELHTLGVDRTYRQRDVVAVAEALTGWGIDEGRLTFRFRQDRHIEGDKKFLGYVLRRDREDGPGQGEKVLEILVRHDDTAEFIATKLVRLLVNDRPPRRLVDRVARTYRKKDGGIVAMLETILESDEFWSRENYRAKFKTPYEFVVSALRITGARIEDTRGVRTWLAKMGQPLYHCDDPTGWYDTAEAWLDPGVMALRWQFALALVDGRLDGVRVPDTFYEGLPSESSPLPWMRAVADRVLPAGASTRTYAMLYEVIRERGESGSPIDSRVLGPEVLGLLLGSPEFQKQ